MVADARTTTTTTGGSERRWRLAELAGMVEKWCAAWRMAGGACSSVDRGGDGKLFRGAGD
jgi:hypothetical protein